MKKIVLTLVMIVSMVTVSFATGKTTDADADATAFRNRVQTYVRNEGYAPSIDNDGDIKFKKEGETYWISVEPYKEGYYVKLFSGTISSQSMYNCLKTANQLMHDYKFMRVTVTESDGQNILYVETTMYCTTLAQFEQMFSSAITAVSTGISEIDSK